MMYSLLFLPLWLCLWLAILESDLHNNLFIAPQNLDFEDISDRFTV